MVKKLRFRFTAVSTLIIFVVLAVVGVAINVMNYYNFIASTEKTMSVIASNNGEFPDYEDYIKMVEEERLRRELEKSREETDAVSPDSPAGTSPLDKFDYTAEFGFGLKVTAETAYETRYFYVRFTPKKNMIGYDLTHIAEVTKEDAESLGRAVLDAERDSGVYGAYRYYRHGTEGGATEIIFLNCANQLRSVSFILYISIATLVAVLAAVIAGLWIMSKKIVKPFVDNLNKQKKFITDAGHELKTPIAIIDANAEVLKLTDGGNEWIDSIQNQTSRLGSLVKRMISLAKSEESLSETPFVSFCISDAALETVTPFELLAEKGGVTLDVDVEPDVKYRGNEASIRQLITILLDNAVKYTPRGGAISFTLAHRGRCVVEVTNDCEGLDPEKLPYLFDRFYRADDARSQSTAGYGIGLSIAKAIVDGHRGKITASSRDGGKISFTVTL